MRILPSRRYTLLIALRCAGRCLLNAIVEDIKSGSKSRKNDKMFFVFLAMPCRGWKRQFVKKFLERDGGHKFDGFTLYIRANLHLFMNQSIRICFGLSSASPSRNRFTLMSQLTLPDRPLARLPTDFDNLIKLLSCFCSPGMSLRQTAKRAARRRSVNNPN